MRLSFDRVQSLIAQTSVYINAIFIHGPGNYQLQFTEPSEQQQEGRRQHAAQERVTFFRNAVISKSVLIPLAERNKALILAQLAQCAQIGTGYCDEYTTVALAYLYTLCQNDAEHNTIHLAKFSQPQYGCFDQIDHVYIVINDPDEKKSLKDQDDDVYIYDPWLNRFFRANQAGTVWQEPQFKDAYFTILPKIVKGQYSLSEYKRDIAEYYQRFNLSESQWPVAWQRGEPIQIIPIEDCFIYIPQPSYDSFTQKIVEELHLPDVPQQTDDDEEERIAIEQRAMIRTTQGTILDSRQFLFFGQAPSSDQSEEESIDLIRQS